MDLNLIRAFVTVFQHTSYTRASEELGISQSAVSQAIRRLEEQVNATLFVKQGRGITPTARASQLARELQPALLRIDSAMSSKREIITYGTEAVLHFIGEVSGVKFVLPHSDQESALNDLRTNRVELLIDNTITRDKAFIIQELMREPAVVVCASNHPRVKGSTLTREQFFQEEHVVQKTRREGQQLVDVFATERLPARKDRVEVSSLSSVVNMVSRTEYIGITTESFARLWSPILSLRFFPLPFSCMPVPFHMVYHQRYADDPHHKQVRENIRQKVEEFRQVRV
ncbi:MAG: LysR family transcriptional regulator [Endozoicomonas sp.]